MCKDRPAVEHMAVQSGAERGRVRSFFLRHPWALVAVASLLTLASAAQAQTSSQSGASPSSPRGQSAVFAALRVGHKVSLSEKGALYEIGLLNDGSIGSYVVVEIGPEHLVLDDLVAVGRRWIPLTAIRSVIWTRVPTLPR